MPKSQTTPPRCPYCGRPAQRRDSRLIYGRSYGDAWICEGYPACDAYVGCHADGRPLGRLANAELRQWKKRAHAAFDPLWRTGEMTRTAAYLLLAELMGLSPREAHIGMFDVGQCRRLVGLLEARRAGHSPKEV